MFDHNGDGQITKEELGESLENLGIYIPDKALGAMIEKIDTNEGVELRSVLGSFIFGVIAKEDSGGLQEDDKAGGC
ncbi:hypothetical protein MRB53_024181 [Persea americana]|uniref:Uncharacterized protein n=1 Tax=Persea americana TaxID=3435 RepID=A0ACC2LCG1_PERAE|nr:hypothetical protein MRB53_024181 [Persea americana]